VNFQDYTYVDSKGTSENTTEIDKEVGVGHYMKIWSQKISRGVYRATEIQKNED
jgi:hypothetical protein